MIYLVGIGMIAVGFLIVWQSDWLMNNMGRNEWADRHLGADGGSRLFYKLIGILLIFGAFLLMGGALQRGAQKVLDPVGQSGQSQGL